MSGNKNFFTLIFIGMGVFTVFTLIAYMSTLGVSGPWSQINTLIAPLIIIIIFIGVLAYVVAHR